MPNEVSDGGPAFPVPMIPIDSTFGHTEVRFDGMTLLDWFAGMWLQGASAQMGVELTEERARATAAEAYRAAGAMLVARKA